MTMSPILSDFVGSMTADELQSLEYFRLKAAMAFPGMCFGAALKHIRDDG